MQKITTFLWFDRNAKAAIDFYTSIFGNSKIVSMQKYPDEAYNEHLEGMQGQILNAIFELEGQRFMALDGGPIFKFNPSASLFVSCDSEIEIDRLWAALSQDGKVLMELQEYPFSKKYGWIEDRFGLSWQLGLGESKQKIVPSLLFVGRKAGRAEEAMKFYVDLFEDSDVEMLMKYGEGEGDVAGNVKFAQFRLNGQFFNAMDSGLMHNFDFNEAVSFYVSCKDQAEVDYFWQNLTAEGGEESQCGWLKDKFGMSWQIVPKEFEELMNNLDGQKAKQVMSAMFGMKKLDVVQLRRASEQI